MLVVEVVEVEVVEDVELVGPSVVVGIFDRLQGQGVVEVEEVEVVGPEVVEVVEVVEVEEVVVEVVEEVEVVEATPHPSESKTQTPEDPPDQIQRHFPEQALGSLG